MSLTPPGNLCRSSCRAKKHKAKYPQGPAEDRCCYRGLRHISQVPVALWQRNASTSQEKQHFLFYRHCMCLWHSSHAPICDNTCGNSPTAAMPHKIAPSPLPNPQRGLSTMFLYPVPIFKVLILTFQQCVMLDINAILFKFQYCLFLRIIFILFSFSCITQSFCCSMFYFFNCW